MIHLHNGLPGGAEMLLNQEQEASVEPLDSGFLERQVTRISDFLQEINALTAQAFLCVINRIVDLLKENFNILFFVGANAFAASSFPHLFFSGLPLGALFAFLAGQTAEHRGYVNQDFYICQKCLLAGAIVQSTLGTLNLLGKSLVHLNAGRFSVAHEGIVSSIVAGALAGAYAFSATSLLIDSMRQRFFS